MTLPSGPSEFGSCLRCATLGPMALPSGPTAFEPCFRTHGLPPISCPQLQLLLLLGGFPLDRGRLSPCPNPHGSPPPDPYGLSSYGNSYPQPLLVTCLPILNATTFFFSLHRYLGM